MLTRRQFGSSSLAIAGSLLLPSRSGAAPDPVAPFIEAIKQLERKSGGRLGVSVLHKARGVPIHYRGDERFPMCSTFKVLASAAILKAAGPKLGRLERRVRIEQTDIVENSPVTREHVGGEGMTLRELCDAAITRSDNTAGNALLKNLGGPAGLTSFARSLGDTMTRLDRTETELNEAAPTIPATPPLQMRWPQILSACCSVTSSPRKDAINSKHGSSQTRPGIPVYVPACRRPGVLATRREQVNMVLPMTSPSYGPLNVRRSSSRSTSPAHRSMQPDEMM